MQLIYFIVRFQRIVIYFSFMYQQGIGMPLSPPAKEVWGKVIFLHLFVILFTGGVHGPGGCLVPGEVHGPGGCLVETPPDGYCCGRYASYWNAFLFTKYFQIDYKI